MAFNWQTFKTRALTAIVFVIVMVAGLLWNHWSFLILFSVIHFGCWWEYLKLTEKIHQTCFHPYLKLGLMVIGYGLMLWFCSFFYQINGYRIKDNFSLSVSAAGFALALLGIFQKNAIKVKAFAAAGLGLLYISLSWGLMIDLGGFIYRIMYADTRYPAYVADFDFPPFDYFRVIFPCAIILSIWINDTMAYIVGSLIGKTPLSKISPKKTWEGTIGGIILCIVVVGLLFSSIPTDIVMPGIHYQFPAITWYIIAGIAAVTGTCGDLLESKLKRMAGVKDSGSLMPGHGGFLDRFDSLLVATPFVWLYLKLL